MAVRVFRAGYDGAVSTPGWYRDPAFTAGPVPRWRWYDGQRWTAAHLTSESQPSLPPADASGDAPLPRPTMLPGVPWLIAVVALVVVGLGATQIGWRAPRVSYIPQPGPGAPVSAPVEPSRPTSECPVAVAGYRNPHPDDASSYGGRLALAKSAIPYDQGPTGGVPPLSSLEDTQTWFLTWQAGNRRQSGVTLGELRRTGFYTSPQDAARRAARCMVADPVRKADVTGSATVTDVAVTVGGRPGWLVVTDVSLNPTKQLGATGERLVVVVVDDGRSDWMSGLAASVRLDRPDLVTKIDQLPGKLTLVG